jgi:hypothetical protein
MGCELLFYFSPPPTAWRLPTTIEEQVERFAVSAANDEMSPHAWRRNRSKAASINKGSN